MPLLHCRSSLRFTALAGLLASLTNVAFDFETKPSYGVRVRTTSFDSLATSLTSTTTLVAFSLVQSHSGRVAALGRSGRGLGARGRRDAAPRH